MYVYILLANSADDGEHSLAEANVYYTRLAEPKENWGLLALDHLKDILDVIGSNTASVSWPSAHPTSRMVAFTPPRQGSLARCSGGFGALLY